MRITRGIQSMLISAIIILAAQISSAQIHSLTIVVEGMSCPFCAYGVEKKLKQVSGVKSIEIDMKDGTAALKAREGESINISQVPKAIKDTGFTPGDISITASGKVKTDARQRLILQVSGLAQGLLLVDLKDDIRQRLGSLSGSEVAVEIQGLARELPDGVWAISPESMKEAPK